MVGLSVVGLSVMGLSVAGLSVVTCTLTELPLGRAVETMKAVDMEVGLGVVNTVGVVEGTVYNQTYHTSGRKICNHSNQVQNLDSCQIW